MLISHNQTVEVLVGARWVVVEQSQPLHAGRRGYLNHVFDRAVAPAHLSSGVLLLGVLSVVDHQVSPSQEINMTLITLVNDAPLAALLVGVPQRWRVGLMVGCVGNV